MFDRIHYRSHLGLKSFCVPVLRERGVLNYILSFFNRYRAIPIFYFSLSEFSSLCH